MKRKIFVILSLILVSALLCSCTSIDTAKANLTELASRITGKDTEQPQTVTTLQTSDGEENVNEKNSFTVGVVNLDTWNPLLTQSTTVKEAMEFVYDTLFEVNTAHEAVPVLASGCSVSPDGKTVTVSLKPDVLWHDGGHFDSYDVVYTANLIMSGATNYGNYLADVASCERAGDLEVKFTLYRSVPDFAALLTFPIIRYKTSMEYSTDLMPVGTGPYSFYGKVSTDSYLLTAFGRYHNGTASIESIDVIEVPDTEKYKLMFEASEIDVITDSMVDIVNDMPKGNANQASFVSNKLTYMGFNLLSPVVSSSPTRRGISLLVDRGEIVSSVMYSKASAVNIPINPQSYLYYDTSSKFGADYEEAYAEFETDGWQAAEYGFSKSIGGADSALSIEILVNSDNTLQTQTAEHIKASLERFGVKAELDKQGTAAYEAKLAARDFDAFIGETTLGANNDLTPLIGGGNYFSYSNANADAIISQIGMTTDVSSREQLFISLCDSVMMDMPFVPLYFSHGSVIYGSRIKSGIQPTVGSDYRVVNLWKVK